MIRLTCRLASSGAASSSSSHLRPFQRLVQCSRLPNASEILRADFEATFKQPLSETSSNNNSGAMSSANGTEQYLHNYIGRKEEVVPYTTTMMRVFTDLGALEDMRLIFAMAINELHQAVPEELYRIYLFSISETDTFTRDEVMNVLSLVQNTGVKLSLISKLCILDLLLKLGLDPIEHVGSIAAEYANVAEIPVEDVELLLKKCDSLLNTVLLTHYNAHWATEMFNLCAKFQIAVSERIVAQMFKLCIAEPSVNPMHIVKAAWIILSSSAAATSPLLKISDDDFVKAVVRCRQWRSLEALQSLQKLLILHNRYNHNAMLQQSFAIATMHVLCELGRVTEAIRLLPLIAPQSTANAVVDFSAYSPYPCVDRKGTLISETHPTFFMAQSLAQLGTAGIDATYYSLTNSGNGAAVEEEGEENAVGIGKEKAVSKTESSANAAPLTTAMMDIVLAACSIIKDEVRALETFNVYSTYNLPYSSDSFMHVLNSIQNPTAALQWQRPAMGLIIAHNVTPSHELLRLMLTQSLEMNDIDNALWVIKINRIYGKTLDRLSVVNLCAKIVAAHDAEAAGFVVKVVEETKTNVDDHVIQSFKNTFNL